MFTLVRDVSVSHISLFLFGLNTRCPLVAHYSVCWLGCAAGCLFLTSYRTWSSSLATERYENVSGRLLTLSITANRIAIFLAFLLTDIKRVLRGQTRNDWINNAPHTYAFTIDRIPPSVSMLCSSLHIHSRPTLVFASRHIVSIHASSVGLDQHHRFGLCNMYIYVRTTDLPSVVLVPPLRIFIVLHPSSTLSPRFTV